MYMLHYNKKSKQRQKVHDLEEDTAVYYLIQKV